MKPTPSIALRLGWVSFLNDCSSEVLARVLPIYLTAFLGQSPAFVGVMEGAAESAAVLLKGVSGWLSDRAKCRKGFVIYGYALSVAARALYLFSLSAWMLGASRVLDRVGKGLRGAPRDAMIADAAMAGRAGRDYGITRFLDTLGAMAGLALVLALGVGKVSADIDAVFRICVWIALPIGISALVLLYFGIPKIPKETSASKRLSWRVPKEISGFLAIVFLFALANSSDAFLALKAREAGFSIREILGLFLVFNALAAVLAIPAGRLSDKFGRLPFLITGWIVYALAYAAMGIADGKAVFSASLLGYGAFYGLTEGVEKALLADLLRPERRGAGFGAFQTVTGIAALLASPMMGVLMTLAGTKAAFLTASCAALIAAALLGLWGVMRGAGFRGQGAGVNGALPGRKDID
ncbi:MAG: MFS transporter [Holophagales bacterium]|nr:MFS transporter [Holophagales bacterium]